MICKRCLYLLLFFWCEFSFAQNNQILFDFNQLPQTLLLNPGAEVQYNKHFGVPFLSNIFVQVGATNTIGELNNKDSYTTGDFFKVYQQLEVLNGGIRLRNSSFYLSFGMYAELNGWGDVDQSDENIKYIKGELSGIFHVGLTKKMNDKLMIGTRLKVVSGNLNLSEQLSSDEYHIGFSNPNYYKYYEDLDSAVPDNKYILENWSKFLPSLFFLDGAGMGLGIDLGFTYKPSQNFIITSSILDLDLIPYSDKLIVYVFGENSSNDEPTEIKEDNHKAFRSPKFNAAAKYQIVRTSNEKYNSVYRNSSYVTPINRELLTEVGIQTFTAFHSGKMVWAVTPYIMSDLNKYLSAKLTYTYNRFPRKNIGLGISTHFKSFNFYVTADNLLDLPKWKDSNYQSAQIGMNFMFY